MNAHVDIGAANRAIVATPRPGALIVGGSIGSLAAARSLGRTGVRVWYLADGYPVPALSRYVERALTWSGAEKETALYDLIALGREHGLDGWVLIPGGDPEVRLIARNHAELSRLFRLTIPDWEVVRWADDKNLTYALAERIGIPVPRRYRPNNLEDVRALECQFPVILKPASHHQPNAFSRAKAWIADDRAALIARYAQAASAVPADEIVLQEMIPGDGRTQFSYAAVWRDGAPLGALTATRSRQYPVNVGYTSSFVETVDNPAVVEAASRFLGALKYSGPVEVEFKFDARDGSYKILDVNPRLWAWVGIGEAAGVDFPALLYRATVGEHIEPVTARAGTAWMHLTRDLVAAAQEMMIGRLSLQRYLAGLRKRIAFAIFATDDVVPALAEPPVTLYRVVRARLWPRVSDWLRPARKNAARG
ncbi:MAG: ATP-grasp domain-containing protein [Pseudolabrys sp.]